MDYNNGMPWKWHREKSSNFDVPPSFWNKVSTNEENVTYMLDEATPIKDCGDIGYIDNEFEETFSQAKRRRMLFKTRAQPLCNKETAFPFIKSKEVDCSFGATLPEASQFMFTFSEDALSSIYESPDQYSEEWVADCLDEAAINSSLDHMNLSVVSDVQIDNSEMCDIPPEYEAKMVQEYTIETPQKIVYKGSKSYIERNTNVPSSVAYPFAFLKPCGVLGGLTLKDINQRIHAPPPLNSKKQSNEKDPSVSYPTSAFSGKPVVIKTKIHTEGRKGSITIMRTKG